jgi:trans-aconitate methyltransferase
MTLVHLTLSHAGWTALLWCVPALDLTPHGARQGSAPANILREESRVPDKQWNAKLYDGTQSFVWKLGEDMVELLAPRKGERILDLGCGTGHLTARISAAGAEVVGMDSSAAMIAQARANHPTLHFETGDATYFAFRHPFDAVFSNAALHWIKNAGGAISCIWLALRPGGRFVAEFGGKGNVESVLDAAPEVLREAGYAYSEELNPWYFPTAAEYRALLEDHGFGVEYLHDFDRHTPLEGGDEAMRVWIDVFAGSFLRDVPQQDRLRLVDALEERLRPQLYKDGRWTMDYHRLRVVASKRGAR